jgi:pseudouridine synthase
MKDPMLQKYIADCGYSSRRRAEELIRAGKVKVNGQVAKLGDRVNGKDEVSIGKKFLHQDQEKVYIIINKPTGYVCSNRRFEGENNIFDLLINRKGKEIKLKHRLFVVGRLDKKSRGLVLVTNDGDLAYRVTHPKFQHEKEYEVRLSNFNYQTSSNVPNDIISKLKKGIHIEGGMAKVKNVKYIGKGNFTVILTQGIKRQIREMFKALGYEVADIKRVSVNVGKIQLDLEGLKKGKWRCLSEKEIAEINR